MINRNKLVELIAACNLQEIFIQHLNWERAKDPAQDIVVQFAEESHTFHVSIVAEKSKFPVCHVRYQGTMPLKSLRRKLEAELLKSHYEHLLVLQDAKGEQVWIYTRKQTDKPDRFVEISAQQPQLVINKLLGLVFSIDDEDGLNITDVVGRAHEQFSQNTERVTRQFYEKFSKHLEKFSEFIKGIEDIVEKKHYASLMLNRLMFIYFIQKRGYLDSDENYLRNRLQTVQKKSGKNQFYKTFYRDFLRRLFHRLSVPKGDSPSEVDKLIGEVPYLNGGLFDEHQIEEENDIYIADKEFKEIFDFFDEYQWYLDDRPAARENEINPDVIGHIFEKYINDRAKMGAYYTKEDITGYIARNTILPALLQKTKEKCKEAFDSESGTIWKLLRETPDDYIYESVRRGCKKADSELPEEIRRGLNPKTDALLESRADWNKEADGEFTLPGETWRECITRRTRYFALKQKIENGDITDIADLTTHNLNIEKLTANAIEQHEGADFISAFYYAIAGRQKVEGKNITERHGLTVLDPACGSGAFLFAALNVLQPLYLGCLARMYEFVEKDDVWVEKTGSKKKHEEYRLILDEVKKHPSEKYWVCRNIILHNLFGVDIMPDAAEVAKLRLFLKLAAESEIDNKKPNMGLEPLPDIDFNIRAGNSLVGFSSMAEFKDKASKELDISGGLIDEIEDEALKVGMAYKHFVEAQAVSHINAKSFKEDKAKLTERLEKLNGKLNKYLAQSYIIHKGDKIQESEISEWKRTHRPFHWFVEFYDIMESGGFDVVVGNPPYVRENKIDYRILSLSRFPDIYGYVTAKSLDVLADKGYMGFLVMLSIAATERDFWGLRTQIMATTSSGWFSFYGRGASWLFPADIKVRNCLMLVRKGRSKSPFDFYVTRLHRWRSEARKSLFSLLSYTPITVGSKWPRFASPVLADFWEGQYREQNVSIYTARTGVPLYYKGVAHNFISVSPDMPLAYNQAGNRVVAGAYSLNFKSEKTRNLMLLLIAGKIGFCRWLTYGDDFHVTRSNIARIPFPSLIIQESDVVKSLLAIYEQWESRLESTLQFQVNAGIKVGAYNTSKLWDITDESDLIFLKYLTDNPVKVLDGITEHIAHTVKVKSVKRR